MKEKIKPTSIHISISLVAAAAILALLFWYWFPSPLMGLGAVQGVQLILIVDLVVGPLCTFIVYKKGKKGLILDFFVIGILQIGALAYGLWAVNSQKPAFMVLSYTGLEVISNYDEKNYMVENGKVVSDVLKLETLKYEGLIPVVLINESADSYERGGDRVEFEFNESMPYYFEVDKYSEIIKLSNVPAINAGKFEFDNNCYRVPISSPHGSSEVCLAEKDGQLIKM